MEMALKQHIVETSGVQTVAPKCPRHPNGERSNGGT